MLLRFYGMYVTFTHGTQILGIELDLVMSLDDLITKNNLIKKEC